MSFIRNSYAVGPGALAAARSECRSRSSDQKRPEKARKDCSSGQGDLPLERKIAGSHLLWLGKPFLSERVKLAKNCHN